MAYGERPLNPKKFEFRKFGEIKVGIKLLFSFSSLFLLSSKLSAFSEFDVDLSF